MRRAFSRLTRGGAPKICSLARRNTPSQFLFEILEGRFAASDLQDWWQQGPANLALFVAYIRLLFMSHLFACCFEVSFFRAASGRCRIPGRANGSSNAIGGPIPTFLYTMSRTKFVCGGRHLRATQGRRQMTTLVKSAILSGVLVVCPRDRPS